MQTVLHIALKTVLLLSITTACVFAGGLYSMNMARTAAGIEDISSVAPLDLSSPAGPSPVAMRDLADFTAVP